MSEALLRTVAAELRAQGNTLNTASGTIQTAASMALFNVASVIERVLEAKAGEEWMKAAKGEGRIEHAPSCAIMQKPTRYGARCDCGAALTRDLNPEPISNFHDRCRQHMRVIMTEADNIIATIPEDADPETKASAQAIKRALTGLDEALRRAEGR